MTTYYISGPMRGKPHYNVTQFAEVEASLALQTHPSEDVIINPAKNFGGDQSLPVSTYMALDLKQVLSADVIVLLPDWQSSEGANREATLGVWAGKDFMAAIKVADSSPWEFEALSGGPEFSTSIRAQACDIGKSYITGDRNNDYGPPWQDFQRTSDAMTGYGYRWTMLPARAPTCPTCGARPLESHDTAIMVDCVKTSRIMWSPTKADHWHDKIGYSACGLECAVHDDEVKRGLA